MGQVLLLALVFFVISTVFSMIGMGGGILYVPILLFAGFSIKQAPAISLILIVATSAAALFTFWRNHKVDWKLALVIDPPTDVMAFVGGYFSALVPEATASPAAPPSRAARRCSRTSVVGFIKRVYILPSSFSANKSAACSALLKRYAAVR
jgi:hypothetical protein